MRPAANTLITHRLTRWRARWLACWVLFLPLCDSAARAQTGPPAKVEPAAKLEEPAEASAPATSQPATEQKKVPARAAQPFNLLTSKTLTGDWGGIRTQLEDIGISLKLEVPNQFMVNMHGGRETKNGHDFLGTYDLDLRLDFEKMKLIKGGSFFIRAKGSWGGGANGFDAEKIGGLFKTDADVCPPSAIFVDKWWYEQRLVDDRITLRAGRIEPTKDLFDTSKVMGNEDTQFLNSALVRSQVIPWTKGLGLYGNVRMTDHAYARAGVIDAEARDRRTGFDTAFHGEDYFRFYTELGCQPELPSPKGPLWGHYRVGTWYDPTAKTKYFDDLDGSLDPRTETGDWGFYSGFDQMLWKEKGDPKDKQGISFAARYGFADGDVNKIEGFWATAIQYEGLVPTRDRDVSGFGVAQGILSNEYRKWVQPQADRETVYELYYAILVTPWLTISPDFQYVTNAGGNKGDAHAMVAGLRLKFSL
jgi:porin